MPDSLNAKPESQYLSPQQFASLTGASIATVRRYLDLGILPKYQPAGPRGRVFIPASAFENVELLKKFQRSGRSAVPTTSAAANQSTNRRPGPAPRWTRGDTA